ncbi:uracil-DNA glycosylase family protein [uncultured Xanthomonas sp.]|uniref:uracil-DNA glycosylase family protein n=1 Tax=uncultured Xanthomonas sp. TaxID=152831 RepID=UPI0025DE284E|nr:uracil-DNA glycosylase family protein [uncultured Xanthomonas sp.]
MCILGRDQGRSEVEHGAPFVGSGGQLVRKALYRHLHHGEEMPDFAAGLEAGRVAFWLNTVPYKPVGNKAWSMPVKRRFHPLMRHLLLEQWRGHEILTLGRVIRSRACRAVIARACGKEEGGSGRPSTPER